MNKLPQDTIKLRFDSLAAGGDAVGRDAGGLAIFAPRTAPGDLAEVAVTKRHKSFAGAHLTRLLQPGSQRVTAPCPYFDSGDIATSCGGCSWQHISYSTQLEAKRKLVIEALSRIGGVAEAGTLVEATVASPQQYAYRNKADFVVSGPGRVGFYAPGTHHTVAVATCAIQQAVNNSILEALGQAMAAGLAQAHDESDGSGVLQRLVARVSSSGAALAIAVGTAAQWPQQREFASFMRAQVPALRGVLRRTGRNLQLIEDSSGTACDWLEEEVDGLLLRVRGDGFFQVNTSQAAPLLATALRLTALQPHERALDLYCGVGLFALGMARSGAQVTGIEVSAQAVEDAVGNAQRNGLTVRFVCADSAALLPKLQRQGLGPIHCVLLDPPRAGAAAALPAIASLAPQRIVYVSCDPATLARDVKTLTAHGYQLQQAVPLDLFPQTAHVETVALLVR